MITIEFQGNHDARPAYTDYRGQGSFVANAGRKVQMGMRDPNELVFDEEVPAGKRWNINVAIVVTETDI